MLVYCFNYVNKHGGFSKSDNALNAKSNSHDILVPLNTLQQKDACIPPQNKLGMNPYLFHHVPTTQNISTISPFAWISPQCVLGNVN